MLRNKSSISRREFLKLSALGFSGEFVKPIYRLFPQQEVPKTDQLGRVFSKVEVKARPTVDAQTIEVLYDDAIVEWLREITGYHPYRFRQRWVETSNGYIWASDLQPVKNIINQPVKTLPDTSLGKGMWVEVTVPYVDIVLENPPISPGFKYKVEGGYPIRLYYSQILWVDQLKLDEEGKTWYRINERFGYGDLMWGNGEAFKPLSQADVSPIHPDASDKLVVVNVEERIQTLSCYEGKNEVYFCRISGGKKYDPDGTPLGKSSTPNGTMSIWRKQISTHMSGGSSGAGYDLPGIGWTALFSGDGVAVHSTFWHNNFGGELMSHGCINACPEDAKWVFRWTNPPVLYDPGDLYTRDTDVPPTKVKIIEE